MGVEKVRVLYGQLDDRLKPVKAEEALGRAVCLPSSPAAVATHCIPSQEVEHTH